LIKRHTVEGKKYLEKNDHACQEKVLISRSAAKLIFAVPTYIQLRSDHEECERLSQTAVKASHLKKNAGERGGGT
jgi:hypothetical protein